MSKSALFCFVLVLLVPLWSQQPQATTGAPAPVASAATRVDSTHHVDAGAAYFRCFAVVPLIGTGQPGDPKRPMFVPAATAIQKSDHTGILGFQMQLSDDKKMALVEFVGASRSALTDILTTTEPTAKVFERGVASKAAIEAEFQKHKKGFTLDSWSPVRPQ